VIPLRDQLPTRTRPVVTWALIGVNVAVWLFQWSLNAYQIGDHTPEFIASIQRWGVVPYYLTQDLNLGSLVTPFTSMFMHSGWLHLIFNVWFLHVFGDNIEDELGRARYLAFYLLSGLGAVALQVATGPYSTTPMVGASGAIAGVLGGYMMLHPRARVVTLVPIFVFVQLVELPAFLFLFVWFGLQLLYGMSSLASPETGGVAFFAHVGGFVVGFALVRLFRRSPPALEPEIRRIRREWRPG
jgi:membrane associated rhomboid family serine protease